MHLENTVNQSKSNDFHGSSRRTRRSERRRSGRRATGFKAWAQAIEALLTAVEQTAWSAREIADLAGDAFSRGAGEFESKADSAKDIATRVAKTGAMLAKIAADYRMFRLRSAFVSEERAAEILEHLHEKNAYRFAKASLKHGGAFLKVGQLLSARPDLMPKAWVRALEPLQDAAPSFAFESVRRIIESDFGRPLGELFASFDASPIAAASIGQVHRAVLFDGTVVAVKVQRPGIAERMSADLMLLETFVHALKDSLPATDLDGVVGEIRNMVMAEVDYEREARVAGSVSELLAQHDGAIAPAPVLAFCSARVVTTRFVDGRKITSVLDELAARRDRITPRDDLAHVELSEILGQLLEAYLRQVLQGGVFQADPHPGNLMVTPVGKVVVLDFGCATYLEEATRKRYLELFACAFTNDRERMTALFTELGFQTQSGRPDTLLAFADALLGELTQAASGNVRWPTAEEFAAQWSGILKASYTDPVVRIPPEFVSIGRVFGLLAGLFAKYEPHIDFSRHVLPTLGPAFFSML